MQFHNKNMHTVSSFNGYESLKHTLIIILQLKSSKNILHKT